MKNIYSQMFLVEFKVKNEKLMHTTIEESDSESDNEFDKYWNTNDGVYIKWSKFSNSVNVLNYFQKVEIQKKNFLIFHVFCQK